MRVCGQEFSTGMLERIESVAQSAGTMSRRGLSRQVCGWMDWRSDDGSLREGSCRKALAELERRGALELPAVQDGFAFHRRSRAATSVKVAELRCSLAQVGVIHVELVASRYGRAHQVWKGLLQEHHPLGAPRLCGAQLRYVIRSQQHGYVGAMAFSGGCWALKARDRFIGWSEGARRSHLDRVITQDRFLIVPTVQVKNLASHILGLAAKRVPEDWEQRYGVRPVLMESFVDPTRFGGTCYRAANWELVGLTSGRRDGIPKELFVYPLCRQWRETLCQEPAVILGQQARAADPRNWAEEEFGTVRLYDERLKQRLVRIAQDFYNRPLANVPEACGDRAGTIGAYRFFANGKISMDVILTPHTESTIERIREHRVVLAPQDTTTLNYCTHPATQGLGPINNIDNSSVGLLLHDTVAFTPEGTPLGVLDAQCWARDPKQKGKRHQRKELPIEQKESAKWLRSFRKVAEIQKLCPNTTLVSIGDRESDIYELLLEATQTPEAPKLLVRSEKSRERKVSELGPLWDHVARQPLAGALQIHIPRRGAREARDAAVEVRFSQVALQPPHNSPHPSVTLWAVYLVEVDQTVEDPVEWMLLTTAEVKTFEQAKQRVEWYAGRWGIEVYHRTLKSGCRIRDRQLGTADRLEACLGVDMVVAWRVYHLTMLGREVPDHPCTVFFEDVEWKALCCIITHSPIPPEEPPSLYEAVRMVGALGGHLGRKSDGMPGTQVLWRGLQRLDTATEMYCVFTDEDHPRIFRSYPHAMQPINGP